MSYMILAAESDPGQRDIAESLQSSPKHDGTGMTITFSVKETAEAGNPADHVVEGRRRVRGRGSLMDKAVKRLPLVVFEDHRAGQIGDGSTEHGQREDAAGHQAIEGKAALQSLGALKLALLDAAAAFEHFVEHLDGKAHGVIFSHLDGFGGRVNFQGG